MQMVKVSAGSGAVPAQSTVLVTSRLAGLWVLVISWLVVLPSATVTVSSPDTTQSH